MKRRDACEWWTPYRDACFARTLAERLTLDNPYVTVVMHSSWCDRAANGQSACTCVPVTLVFGATA